MRRAQLLNGFCRCSQRLITSQAVASNEVFSCDSSTSFLKGNEDSELVRLKNKQLSSLIRNGRFREARRLFDGMAHRSVVTWNSMISGYVRRRELGQARKLFEEMPRRDVVSWNSLLLGYALSRDPRELEEARRLFDGMPERDSISWNTMIRGYMRSGKMEEGISLFRKMSEVNVVTWNTVITGYLENGRVSEAMKMFERMPISDGSTLCSIVSGLVRNDMLEDAEQLLVKRWRMGETEGLVFAYNTLIAGYGQRDKVGEARRLFNMIPNRPLRTEKDKGGGKRSILTGEGVCRNVVTWNTMMMCYIKAGDIFSARELFDKMLHRDLFSWNTMISGYVRARDVEAAASLFVQMHHPDAHTWNAMILGYAQDGDLLQARGYFDKMPHRNLVSWNTMISGYEQNEHYEEAIKLFMEMQEAGEVADQHTLSSIISAAAGMASLSLGTQIHQFIIKTYNEDVPINNSLVTMYGRCGKLVDATSVFNYMDSERDFISWNAIIGAYAQHGHAAEALLLFKEMEKSNVGPTHITFISVLSACCHAGLVAEGQRVFDHMVKQCGIMPSVEHYALLVNLIGRHGRLEDALRIIDDMPVPPDKSVWGALLDACKIHKDCDLARIAADALMKVDPEGGAAYVLLYNMYADMGRWDDAAKVREILDIRRIKKQPGCSWIELHGKLHNFNASDKSHPLSSEIFALIENYEKVTQDGHLHVAYNEFEYI